MRGDAPKSSADIPRPETEPLPVLARGSLFAQDGALQKDATMPARNTRWSASR